MNTQLAFSTGRVAGDQKQKVLEMLRAGPVCGTVFLKEHLPRYGARLWDLKKLGYEIERTRCFDHQHVSTQYKWKLIGSPVEGAGAVTAPAAGERVTVPASPRGDPREG